MDRTPDLIHAAERFLETASLPPEQSRRLREAIMLGRRSRTAAPQGSFAVAAKGVEDSIRTLWTSVRGMQQEYAREAGALADPDPVKDANEAQLAAFIGRIGGYIDRLKEAASGAQGQGQGPSAGAAGGGAERVNEHTAAHMHGVVLILAERLHRATRAFDRLRAARYQALVDRRPPGAAHTPAAGAAAGPTGAAESSGPSGSGSGNGGRAAAGKQAGGGGLGNAFSAAARNGWQHILGMQLAEPKGHEPQDHRREPHAGGRGGGGWPVQVQEVELENKALLERLTATRNAVLGVEQSVRDVAALNQMFSSAVLAQAETIESIYLAAVEATHNISAGNTSLHKTVEVNRSTSRYLLVLLLAATLCLLFFDWFNS